MQQKINAQFIGTFPKRKPVDWIWFPYLPHHRITILDGDPGLGKSFVALDIAARVTRGAAWPTKDGDKLACVPSSVLICNCEDEKETSILPRLAAAGADASRICFGDSVVDGAGKTVRYLSLPEDKELLATTVRDTQASLVIIDPVMSFLSEKVRTQSDQSVRNALHSLNQICENEGPAFLLVRHLNKSGGTKAIYRGGGSIGFVGLARSAMLIARNPEDKKQCLLTHFKSNVGPVGSSLAYRLKFSAGVGKVIWLGESEITANQALLEHEDPSPLNRAVEFVKHFLAKGPRAIIEIISQAKGQHLSASTIMRVGSRLTLFPTREYYKGRLRKFWALNPAHENDVLKNLPKA